VARIRRRGPLDPRRAFTTCGGVRWTKISCGRRCAIPSSRPVRPPAAPSAPARLGGSAVGDIIVSGAVAGHSAAEAAAKAPEPDPCEDQVAEEEEKLASVLARKGAPVREVTAEIRDLMWRKVGPVRRRGTLASAREELEQLRGALAKCRPGARGSCARQSRPELMLDVGTVIATAALTREESRGNHWRLDHPQPDNEKWLCNLVLQRQPDGSPRVAGRAGGAHAARGGGPVSHRLRLDERVRGGPRG